MLAAEATFKSLVEGSSMELYWENLKKSWIWEELHKARNYRPVCGYFIIDYPKQNYLWYLVKCLGIYGGGGEANSAFFF